MNRSWLETLAADVATMRARGQEVVIVSSGAIALGRRQLGLPKGKLKLEESQAAAAVGQIRLAHAWKEVLEAHGFAVAQALVARRRLEGVTERMSEVQNPPEAALVFIGTHDLGLDPAAGADDLGECVALLRQHRVEMPLEQVEQRPFGDQSVLDHLVESGPELPPRQRDERDRVDHDDRRRSGSHSTDDDTHHEPPSDRADQ